MDLSLLFSPSSTTERSTPSITSLAGSMIGKKAAAALLSPRLYHSDKERGERTTERTSNFGTPIPHRVKRQHPQQHQEKGYSATCVRTCMCYPYPIVSRLTQCAPDH
jgi:hypothetical protein